MRGKKKPQVVLGQPDSLAARSTKKICATQFRLTEGRGKATHLRAGSGEAVEQTVSSDIWYKCAVRVHVMAEKLTIS